MSLALPPEVLAVLLPSASPHMDMSAALHGLVSLLQSQNSQLPISSSAMVLTIAVPDDSSAKLLRLVAAYSGLNEPFDVAIKNVTDVEFAAADGSKAFGAHTACCYIASLSPSANQLLGDSAEQQAKVRGAAAEVGCAMHGDGLVGGWQAAAVLLPNMRNSCLQIAEWISFRNTALQPLMDAQLAELNAALATRTYVAGGAAPSLADLVLYAAVAPAATAFPVAQHGHFCNLLRWYDLLNHTADGAGEFPAASFLRPRYVPPPPPAAEPKAAKNGDKATDKKVAATPAESGSGSEKKAAKASAAAAAAPPAAADAGGKADKKVGSRPMPPSPPFCLV